MTDLAPYADLSLHDALRRFGITSTSGRWAGFRTLYAADGYRLGDFDSRGAWELVKKLSRGEA